MIRKEEITVSEDHELKTLGLEFAIETCIKRLLAHLNTSCDTIDRDTVTVMVRHATLRKEGKWLGEVVIRATILQEYDEGPSIEEGGLCMHCMHFDNCDRLQHHNGPHRLKK